MSDKIPSFVKNLIIDFKSVHANLNSNANRMNCFHLYIDPATVLLSANRTNNCSNNKIVFFFQNELIFELAEAE